MLLFRAFLVSLATANIDLPRDWQAQHCRGTHLERVAASQGFALILHLGDYFT